MLSRRAQAIVALGQPCFTNSPARLAMDWFPKAERDLATVVPGGLLGGQRTWAAHSRTFPTSVYVPSVERMRPPPLRSRRVYYGALLAQLQTFVRRLSGTRSRA